MSINDKKGINLTSGFKYVGGQPLDVRLIAEDESDLQSLVEINLPKVISLPLQSLALCQSLKKLDLGACISIEKEALGACSELRTLIIRTTSQVCTLAEDALVVTPISDGEGYVYVPDELVASYKADTNWQSALPNYSTQIKPLSEYVEA